MLPFIEEAEVTMTSSDPTVVTRSRSGRKVSRSLEQHRWLFDVTWPSYLSNKAIALENALDAMTGQAVADELVHPVRSYHPQASGSWQAVEPASAGDTDVILSGSGSLTIGHLIRFYGHSKCYKVVSTAGSIVSLYPPLRSNVTQTEPVTVNAVPILVTRTDDDVSYKTNGPLTSASAGFEEQL